MRSGLPVLSVLAVIVGIWYLAVAPMNVRVALDQAERADAAIVPEGSVPRRDVSVWRLMLDNAEHVALGYALERPRLPTPGQVGAELWKTTGEMIAKGRPFSKRGLIYHGWITLQSTLWGFLLGTTLGIVGAVAIFSLVNHVVAKVFGIGLDKFVTPLGGQQHAFHSEGSHAKADDVGRIA